MDKSDISLEISHPLFVTTFFITVILLILCVILAILSVVIRKKQADDLNLFSNITKV